MRPRRSTQGRIALNAAVAETVSVIALLAVLAWAVIRPRGWPEQPPDVGTIPPPPPHPHHPGR